MPRPSKKNLLDHGRRTVIDYESDTVRRILDADPSERADAVRELWSPLAGMYHFVPGGLDLATVHAQQFGFPLDAGPRGC